MEEDFTFGFLDEAADLKTNLLSSEGTPSCLVDFLGDVYFSFPFGFGETT